MATYRELAMRMIPVLVRWAQATWDKPHYYSNLSEAIGHGTNQIGGVMGTIQDIIDDLKKKYHKEIPTLNSLVRSKSTGLPSDGFDYVVKNYSKLSPDSKNGEVNKLNYKAHLYDWDWVLKALGLQPAIIVEEKEREQLMKSTYGSGGEGEEHRKLKNYIATHPEVIGIEKVIYCATEYELLSGDRLDVYFECKGNKHYAVEVKPNTSSDGDVLRGIFQCIKYQAVMDSMRVVDNDNYENTVKLVVGGSISDSNKMIANDLNVKIIELPNTP